MRNRFLAVPVAFMLVFAQSSGCGSSGGGGTKSSPKPSGYCKPVGKQKGWHGRLFVCKRNAPGSKSGHWVEAQLKPSHK